MEKMVFDIGAHKGDDTAVYLSMGYKVIAVEANQQLIPLLKKRFYEEINQQRLVVLNYAITDHDDKEVILYLNEDSSKNSLFSNNSKKENYVIANSKKINWIIKKFGEPFFCKIDIEGADLQALKGLNDMSCLYISVEICGDDIKTIKENPSRLFYCLDELKRLGYTKFKLVDQESLHVLQEKSFYKRNQNLIRRIFRKLSLLSKKDKKVLFLKKYKLKKDAEVSGLPSLYLKNGEIMNRQRMIQFHFNEFINIVRTEDIIFWVDIHATK